MKLSECLVEAAVEVQSALSGKDEVLAQMIELMEKTDGFMDRETLLSEITEREALGSTGIGRGVAIPHVHLESVDKLHVAMMTTGAGVDYGAIDDEPCRIFIMVVAPDSDREGYLKLLAEVSRLFNRDEVRDAVVGASSPAELLEILADSEND